MYQAATFAFNLQCVGYLLHFENVRTDCNIFYINFENTIVKIDTLRNHKRLFYAEIFPIDENNVNFMSIYIKYNVQRRDFYLRSYSLALRAIFKDSGNTQL